MKDTTSNKSNRITVRLTQNQSFMLDEMSKQFEVNKASLMRFALDQFIKQYNKSYEKLDKLQENVG